MSTFASLGIAEPILSALTDYGYEEPTAIQTKAIPAGIAGRDVLLVEDILDTGPTLSKLVAELQARGPASLKLCVLLDKPDRRTKPIQADYVGFTIPDAFVVGCGLDYDQRYRNLPYIGILKPSVYEKNP